LWRETHPEEYKQQQEDDKNREEKMKKNLKLLKKEVKHDIRSFIKKAKTMKSETAKKKKLLKKLKQKYERVTAMHDEMLQIEADKANEEAGLEAEKKFDE
jgi:hypothetical protein